MVGRVIAVLNFKGGVGKSTTAVNLSAALSAKGRHVLAVDLDAQANLTTWIGTDKTGSVLADVLRDPKKAKAAIGKSAAGFDLLYGSRETAIAEREMQSGTNPATVLRRVLRGLSYDVTLLDCPPGLSLLSINAIAAADELLVPVQAQGMALAGLGLVRQTIDELLEAEVITTAPRFRVLVTMYDGRVGLAKAVLGFLHEAPDVETFTTPIRMTTKIAEAFGQRESIFSHAPSSTGAFDYAALSEEL